MKTLAALLLIGASAACAAVDFEKDIRPVLRERCVKRGHRKVDAGEPRRLAEEVEGARASTEDWALGTEH